MIFLMNYNILQRCGEHFGGPFRDQMMGHPAHFRLFLLFFLGTIFLVLFVKFLVAWLVYKDATAKNIENRKIWFFLVFITSILGAIFYFLMVIYQHKNNTLQTNNQSNSTQATSQSTFSPRICKNCGNEGDGKFCTFCGSQF